MQSPNRSTMTTEVIIAARGEIPANLVRTVTQAAKVSPVCVVFDGDERGNETPPEVADLARVVRLPGKPSGCGHARHAGITSSEANLIILMDGHMTLPDGWLKATRKHHAQRRNHLTCCMMQSLDQHGKPLTDKPQGGAFLALKTREVCGTYWALSAKWNDPPKEPGPVAAIMGACYAFRRSWYDAIGQPLQVLRAWGGDEELLTLGTYCMGGHVHMLPVTVGHIYMAAHTGRIKTADESDAIWGNRLTVLHSIPMAPEETRDLCKWMAQTKRISGSRTDCTSGADKLKALWASGSRPWDQLKDAGVVRNLTEKEQAKCLDRTTIRNDERRAMLVPPPAAADDKPQIIMRHEVVCERCNAREPFRQSAGKREVGAFGIAYAKCFNCGHKGQIRTLHK